MHKALNFFIMTACLLGSGSGYATPSPTLVSVVRFAKDATSISSRDIDELNFLNCELKSREIQVMLLVGHADTNERNAEKLARQRVLEVSKVLLKMGIDPKKMYLDSKGSRQADSSDRAGANRRVDIEVLNTPLPNIDVIDRCMRRWEKELYSRDGKVLIAAKKMLDEEGWSVDRLLTRVISENRADLLADLMKNNSGISLHELYRRDLLEYAARRGQPALLKPLINAWRPSDVLLPLSGVLKSAVCGGARDENRIETVRLLFDWGGSLVLATRETNDSPLSCLDGSTDMAMADLLLSRGVSPTQPEWLVLSMRDHAMVHRLLRAGANPLARSDTGSTLFHACKLEKLEDVEWLLSLGLDINATNQYGNTPLHGAVRYASKEVLDFMLKSGAKFEKTIAGNMLTSAHGNLEAFLWLLQHGVQVENQADLLILLAKQGDRMLPAMTALIERGIDINQQDSRGYTALSTAIQSYRPSIVRYLLELGADQERASKSANAMQLAERLDAIQPMSLGWYSTPSPYLLRAKQEIIEILLDSKSRRLH